MLAAALALAVSSGSVPVTVSVSRPAVPSGKLGAQLPLDTTVHLGISLRAASIEAMRQRAADQQDPTSPHFRRWLTPADFGRQFGLPDSDYARVKTWLTAAGFQPAGFDDHLFIEAFGSHASLQTLLGVQLYSVVGADGHSYRTFRGSPQAPGDLAPLLLNVSGLDTRPRFHAHVLDTQGDRTFGPQDLRRFYDVQPLLNLGYTGRGARLVVLGVAVDPSNAPQSGDIQFFFANYADTTAAFETRTLTNVNRDFDSAPGARAEMELDVEVQAIAAPGAASITLELPPASEQLSTGAHDVATLMNVTAVSTSFGMCEASTTQAEAQAVEQVVLQGTLAGQTWVAAAGDRGADDCGDGSGPAVDMPADVPEMVAVGGTQVVNPTFDARDAITGYQQEVTWNQGSFGAGGGGKSALFGKPGWQLVATPGDQARDLPDLALFAAPFPGVAADVDVPAYTSALGGTSVSAPLAAGIFAVLADRLGCRLGGVNPALYAAGLSQLDGGRAAFHDVVLGDNGLDGVQGEVAAVGYDLATGWGSIDLLGLASAFPACPVDAGALDAGPLVPYDSCAALGCGPGSTCVTTPEGPSSCVTPCDPQDAGSCGSGSLCVSVGGGGQCVPGCLTDGDCPAGDSCDPCGRSCRPSGNVSASIGDACQVPADCTTGGMCLADGTFPGGYCTQLCNPCTCPAGNLCGALNFDVCLRQCSGATDCRTGYACQPFSTAGGLAHLCLPHCKSDTDCGDIAPGTVCEMSSGTCTTPTANDGGVVGGGTGTGGGGGGGAHPGLDGGDGHGSSDAGASDAGPIGEVMGPTGGGSAGGTSPSPRTGGGCSQAGGSELSLLALLGLVCLAACRRRRPSLRSE
jgi:hypothetical protein